MTIHTTQIKSYCIINGVKEFVWSISYDSVRGNTFKLNSGKVHKILDTDDIQFID